MFSLNDISFLQLHDFSEALFFPGVNCWNYHI